MRVQPLFKGSYKNTPPHLTEEKKRELEYIKKKYDTEQLKYARLYK